MDGVWVDAGNVRAEALFALPEHLLQVLFEYVHVTRVLVCDTVRYVIRYDTIRYDTMRYVL